MHWDIIYNKRTSQKCICNDDSAVIKQKLSFLTLRVWIHLMTLMRQIKLQNICPKSCTQHWLCGYIAITLSSLVWAISSWCWHWKIINIKNLILKCTTSKGRKIIHQLTQVLKFKGSTPATFHWDRIYNKKPL
jgi:hypothetical protein